LRSNAISTTQTEKSLFFFHAIIMLNWGSTYFSYKESLCSISYSDSKLALAMPIPRKSIDQRKFSFMVNVRTSDVDYYTFRVLLYNSAYSLSSNSSTKYEHYLILNCEQALIVVHDCRHTDIWNLYNRSQTTSVIKTVIVLWWSRNDSFWILFSYPVPMVRDT
jgi:hypothetical protein